MKLLPKGADVKGEDMGRREFVMARWQATAAIVLMAAAVAALSDRLGFLTALDAKLAVRIGGLGLDGGIRQLPAWAGWLWMGVAVTGLTVAVLHVGGMGRQLIIVTTMLVLHFCWIPVMALSGWVVGLAGATLGLVWATVCALTYAVRHPIGDVK